MWEVEFTDTFGAWWTDLAAEQQERLTAAVELLEQGGPALGRPLVDTLADRLYDEHLRELHNERTI